MFESYISGAKLAAFLMAALVPLFVLAAPASAAWKNSDITGSVKAEEKARLQDDFHRSVNHDWLSSAKIRAGEASVNSFSEREDEVEAQIKALLADKTLSSHEAKLAQSFHSLALDWKSRDSAGITPVLPYLKRIEAVKSLEELTSYLTDSSIAHFGGFLCDMGTQPDNRDASNYTTGIYRAGLLLRDADEYRKPELSESAKRRKSANDLLASKMLKKAGYSQEEAQKLIESHFEVEKVIAAQAMGLKKLYAPESRRERYNVRSRKELEAASPNFPLVQLADSLGYGKSREFVLSEPKWLEAMNDLYREENLRKLKAFLLVRTVLSTANLLDREARNWSVEAGNAVLGSKGSVPDDKYAYNLVSSYLDEPLGRVYAAKYADPASKERIKEVIAEVVAYYRTMLKDEKWLSEKTRAKAVKKLDNLTVRVSYPDKWEDYSGLNFAGAEDGGSLTEAVFKIGRFERERDAKQVNTKVDRSKWFAVPQMVNAYYSPSDNSINIPAGILGGVFYSPHYSAEETLGGIGMVIGHEITHAFDTNGSQYDEKGNMVNWWTEADNSAFKDRAKLISDYYSTLEAMPGVKADGELVLSEAIADLGGVGCMTAIGRGKKDFDFAKFFKTYARCWRIQTTSEAEEYKTREDVHPLAFLRTNVNVQQMPEFYSVFGIKPEDGMYLAPEKRVALW